MAGVSLVRAGVLNEAPQQALLPGYMGAVLVNMRPTPGNQALVPGSRACLNSTRSSRGAT